MNSTQRVFLVQLIPDRQLKKWHVSQAANNFFRNLISSGVFDQVVTLVPVSVADDLRQECLKMPEIDRAVQCRWFPHKTLGKWLNSLIENLCLFKLLLRAKTIWFYNITSCNFIAFVLLHLCRKKLYLVLADFSPVAGFGDIRRLCAWCIKHSDGIISLSGRTEFKHSNMKVLPGIVPTDSIRLSAPAAYRRYFLFSGTLNAVTGIDMALKTFGNAPEFPLVVTGACENDEKIRRQVAGHDNIRYLGNLPFDEYRKVLQDATWALNLRDPQLPENANNFPSKFLEYLAMGKIVLSTMRYPELTGFRYFYADYDEKSIQEALCSIVRLTQEETQQIREHNQHLLLKFSEKQWKKTVLQIEGKEV